MKNNTPKRKPIILILVAAIIAAAWLIVGPGVLKALGAQERLADVFVNGPAMLVALWLISGNRSFIRCEYRTWKRIIGK